MTELSPKVAERKPYDLKKKLIQAGVELQVGDKASLTKAQAERLAKEGVI